MKKLFQKILVFILATALLCGGFALAGCDSTPSPAGPSLEDPSGDQNGDGNSENPTPPDGPSDKDPDGKDPDDGKKDPDDGDDKGDGGDDNNGGGNSSTKPTLPAGTETYYASITAASGNALLGQLHDLITATHTHYSSYSECRDYAHTTDYAAGGEKSIIEFYTHETIVHYINDISTPGNQGTWNREHVWPKSLSNNLWKGSNTVGGGADMHHIRPSEVKMNGTRGDDKYGEAVNGSAVWSKTESGADSQIGGYHAGGVFEPLDNVKGDVARILFYVYTHYNTYANVHGTTNGNTNGQTANYFGTLRFTNVVSASSEAEAIALLLEWNELDPVDAIETKRNEEVCKIQGNRNPFIDYAGWADAIWG